MIMMTRITIIILYIYKKKSITIKKSRQKVEGINEDDIKK